MVGRHEEIAHVVVVDLDGTLLRCNTFRLYSRLCFRHLLSRRRYMAFARLAAWAAMRKLSLASHNRYRGQCVREVGFPPALLDSLSEMAAAAASPSVAAFIASKRAEGYGVLLATAALSGYVRALWNGKYVASEASSGRVMSDCRGQAKLERVLGELDGRTPAYVLSDSSDDFPLMRYAAAHGGKAVLVNPSERALRFFRKLEPAELFDVELLLDSGEAR